MTLTKKEQDELGKATLPQTGSMHTTHSAHIIQFAADSFENQQIAQTLCKHQQHCWKVATAIC